MNAKATLSILLFVVLSGLFSHDCYSRLIYLDSVVLGFSGEGNQITGDLALGAGGAAAVYSQPEGFSPIRMKYYFFSPDGTIAHQNTYSSEEISFYSPAICTGPGVFGIAVSAITGGLFMILNPDGNLAYGPVELPGVPDGWRTGGFEIVRAGGAYAIFGLLLEPEFPFQDITQGNFYTHLYYWLIEDDGTIATRRELGMLAPITYPGSEGFEKVYYDVAWNGQSFFLAYYSESEQGPPLSTYYKMFDLGGNALTAERQAFATTSAKGPEVATDGNSFGLVALKEVTLTGNFIYVRFFDAAGNPYGAEVEYGDRLGFAPTIFWQGDKFLTAYCSSNPYTLEYPIVFHAHGRTGNLLDQGYAMADAQQNTVGGTMAMGIDLQFVSDGKLVFGKSQTTNYIVNTPVIHLLQGDAVFDYQNLFGATAGWNGAEDDYLNLLELMERMR